MKAGVIARGTLRCGIFLFLLFIKLPLSEQKELQGHKNQTSLRSSWKEAFSAIRNLNSLNESYPLSWGPSDRQSSSSRMDDSLGWDEKLDRWRREAIAYYEETEKDLANRPYPMSTFGWYREEEVKDVDISKVANLRINDDNPPLPPFNPPPHLRKATALPSSSPPSLDSPILPHTDLSDPSKYITIVTTASLPWKTGTAVNPLLRAAYLIESRHAIHVKSKSRAPFEARINLFLPWLERHSDQTQVYGPTQTFETSGSQESFIRGWLRDTAELPNAATHLNITWYNAWQEKAENSVYSMGDITALIADEQADICVLEEPEHLNWYRAPGDSWTTKFKYVIGVVHTNYFVYAQEQPAALIRAPAMRLLCSWMIRAHCHRAIKLSGALGKFAEEKEVVENVHGVRSGFIDVGRELRNDLTKSAAPFSFLPPNSSPSSSTSLTELPKPKYDPDFQTNVYFIGKMLWSKGIGTLMELLEYSSNSAGLNVTVDMYGSGPDLEAAKKKASTSDLSMAFHGAVDHLQLSNSYKIFVNPSTSEVLCTTVAEALAMGKFVVIPSHPSNDFFTQFPNCLPYSNKEEFVGNLYYALTHDPEPMSDQYLHILSWEAATERFQSASAITTKEWEALSKAHVDPDVGGIEISLPPLVGDDARKQFTQTLRNNRARYRTFRGRLLEELDDPTIPLPQFLKRRMKRELSKRLDLDLEKMFDSPKVQLLLSPAELDRQLLDLYNRVSKSPGGDVLRVIGGGADVGKQNQYMRRARRRGARERDSKLEIKRGVTTPLGLGLTDAPATLFFPPKFGQRAAQSVQHVLEKNLANQNRILTNNLAELYGNQRPNGSDDTANHGNGSKNGSLNMCPMCWNKGGRQMGRKYNIATMLGTGFSGGSLISLRC